jgi:hypothetical protein
MLIRVRRYLMDTKKNSGLGVNIVDKSKFTGVSPSTEMGVDIEPTATSPDVGTTSEIEPTEPSIDIGQYRPDDGGRIQYEDQSKRESEK